MNNELNEKQEPDPGRRRVWNTGLGIALGAGIGAAVFTATNEPIWIALGAALGTVFGAIRFR